jgi:hypothetical protein
MNGFLAALKAELFVALRSNSARLLVVLPAFIVIARASVVKLTETGQQAREALLGGAESAAPTANAWGHFVDSFATRADADEPVAGGLWRVVLRQ